MKEVYVVPEMEVIEFGEDEVLIRTGSGDSGGEAE